MRVALRQVAGPIVASGGTVVAGVLCLLFSDLNSNRSLGPVAALGIVAAVLVALTFLPAVLALLGRAAFWPVRPSAGSAPAADRGLWPRVARVVTARPRRMWLGVGAVLLALAGLIPTFEADGVGQSELFLGEVEAVRGQEALARHFPGGEGAPAVIAAPDDALDEVLEIVSADPGVATAQPVADRSSPPGSGAEPQVVDDHVLVEATLAEPADSDAAVATVERLRADLDRVGDDVLVGGTTAQQLDTNTVSARDRTVIIPIVLVVILAVLAVLLRAIVAPLLLVATVVLSFAATLGVAGVVFSHVFGWPGADPGVPLFAFVFLVALGVDYNIFLMTRIREESVRLGTRRGVQRGLVVTGAVITSAGIVLAATFSALGVIPILFLAQIAFLVAFGVLLDTVVVRSLLVPALAYDIGPRIWWPSRLAREPQSSMSGGG